MGLVEHARRDENPPGRMTFHPAISAVWNGDMPGSAHWSAAATYLTRWIS